jgi:hypothetical protein
LAAELRSVFRRLGGVARGSGPAVCISTGPDGTHVSTRICDVAAEYHVPGNLPEEQLWAPYLLLSDCEGKQDEPVQLERGHDGSVVAAWSDRGIPQRVQYDQVLRTAKPDLPERPPEFSENPPELLAALHDTMTTTDPDSIRYAIGCVQFRGRSGTLAATDGRQMLLVRGFRFPWADNVLVPAAKVFGHRELPQDQHVHVGRTDDAVVIAVGAWTFWLRINKEGKFPDVDRQIPKAADAVTRCRFAPADAEFLAKTLPKLPSEDAFNSPVTLDLNGAVVVRAKPPVQDAPADAKPTEVVLSQSVPSGEAMWINTNRRYLARALSLGFREVLLYAPERPVMCRDKRRTYLWAVLGPEAAIAPTGDAVRIVSAESTAADPIPKPKTTRRKTTLSETVDNPNGHAAGNGSAKSNGRGRRKRKQPADQHQVGSLIEQAEALRGSLRDTLLKTNELLKGLKQQRQQSRMLETTLANLRQLKTLNV